MISRCRSRRCLPLLLRFLSDPIFDILPLTSMCRKIPYASSQQHLHQLLSDAISSND